MRLEALFRPKSIAVIGASEKPAIGRRLIASLDRFGFSGWVFPAGALGGFPRLTAKEGRPWPIPWCCTASTKKSASSP